MRARPAPSRTLRVPALAILGGLLLLASCSRDRGTPEPEQSGAAAPSAKADSAGADSLRSYHTPDGFPLPFSTSIPRAASVTRPGGNGGGAAIHFTLPGEGPGPQPYVNLFVLPPATDAPTAMERADAFVTGLGQPVSHALDGAQSGEAAWLAWALRRIPFRYRAPDGGELTGAVAVGWHAGRYFELTVHGPAPDSAWLPDARRLLDAWRWGDGARLARGGAPEAPPGYRPPAVGVDTSGSG